MEALGAVMLLALGMPLGATMMWLYLRAERPDRELRRDAELRALRAANELSLLDERSDAGPADSPRLTTTTEMNDVA
jgi:hypothetical protein